MYDYTKENSTIQQQIEKMYQGLKDAEIIDYGKLRKFDEIVKKECALRDEIATLDAADPRFVEIIVAIGDLAEEGSIVAKTLNDTTISYYIESLGLLTSITPATAGE